MTTDRVCPERFFEIKKFYNKLDDSSKRIFDNRWMYWLTEEYRYISEMIDTIPLSDFIVNSCVLRSNQDIVIFGAGHDGEMACGFLKKKGFKVHCFCDNSREKQENLYMGLPVISVETLVSEYKHAVVVVSSRYYSSEIYSCLIGAAFPQASICFLADQYFDKEIVRLQEDEVFIDAGCYDAFTSIQFAQKCNNTFKKIYAFEPEDHNYMVSKHHFEAYKISNFELIRAGLWHESSVLHFTRNDSGSRVEQNGETMVRTVLWMKY